MTNQQLLLTYFPGPMWRNMSTPYIGIAILSQHRLLVSIENDLQNEVLQIAN